MAIGILGSWINLNHLEMVKIIDSRMQVQINTMLGHSRVLVLTLGNTSIAWSSNTRLSQLES